MLHDRRKGIIRIITLKPWNVILLAACAALRAKWLTLPMQRKKKITHGINHTFNANTNHRLLIQKLAMTTLSSWVLPRAPDSNCGHSDNKQNHAFYYSQAHSFSLMQPHMHTHTHVHTALHARLTVLPGLAQSAAFSSFPRPWLWHALPPLPSSAPSHAKSPPALPFSWTVWLLTGQNKGTQYEMRVLCTFLLLLRSELYLSGSPVLVRFLHMWTFIIPTIEVVTFLLLVYFSDMHTFIQYNDMTFLSCPSPILV